MHYIAVPCNHRAILIWLVVCCCCCCWCTFRSFFPLLWLLRIAFNKWFASNCSHLQNGLIHFLLRSVSKDVMRIFITIISFGNGILYLRNRQLHLHHWRWQKKVFLKLICTTHTTNTFTWASYVPFFVWRFNTVELSVHSWSLRTALPHSLAFEKVHIFRNSFAIRSWVYWIATNRCSNTFKTIP